MDIPVELLLQKWGPTSLLALAVLLLFWGHLVPKRTLDDARTQRDEYKKTVDALVEQNRQLLESAKTTDNTLRAISQVATGEENPQ